MARNSASISPTAHYTGYTWYRHGLSHPALVTPQGRWLHGALRPVQAVAHWSGAPTLQAFLLARHAVIDHLLQQAIEHEGVTQVIEVAAGLSPRGWHFKRRHGDRLRYVEADLPGMARRKRDLLRRAGLQTPGHEVVELDALATQGPLSLGALADTLDARAGTVIITEGLLNYFDEAHVRQMWRQFAAVLGRFAQGRYYSDLHLANTHHRGAMLRGFTTLLSVFVRGRVHLHFRDSTQACAALREAGFRSAVLHEPREFAAALPFALGPGANLVRIIEARCGREDSPVGRYNHSE